MSKQSKQDSKIYTSLPDIYKSYPKKDLVSATEFREISNTFFHLMTKAMIDEGYIFYLPPKMGTLGVYKIGKTKKMIDYDLYKKTGIKANIKNRHTHGSMVKFY